MRSFHTFAMRFVVTAQVSPSSSTVFPHPVRPNPLPHAVTCDTTEVEAAQANSIGQGTRFTHGEPAADGHGAHSNDAEVRGAAGGRHDHPAQRGAPARLAPLATEPSQ